MSDDDYIEIFNSVINVRGIIHPIGVSPKAFKNSYMCKRGGSLSITSFIKLNGLINY